MASGRKRTMSKQTSQPHIPLLSRPTSRASTTSTRAHSRRGSRSSTVSRRASTSDAYVAGTLVLRRPRVALQETLISRESCEVSATSAMRAANSEELLARVGVADLVLELLQLVDMCPLIKAEVPKLECWMFYRSFEIDFFGTASEHLKRSLSNVVDEDDDDDGLSGRRLIEYVFERYLRNDVADFLLNGNDSAQSQLIAGAVLLVRSSPDGHLSCCGTTSVEHALGNMYGLDFERGVILARNVKHDGALPVNLVQ